MSAVALTFFPKLRDSQGTCVRTTWSKLLERLSVPRISADKHAVPGLSFATFVDDRRALANVELVYVLGLDLDKQVPAWSVLEERFGAADSFVHSTWSSTLLEPRARAFLRLSRAVTSDEYRTVYGAIAGIVEGGGLVVDRAASDPSRFWFLPSIQPGASFRSFVGGGEPVNVDAFLAAAPKTTAPEPAPYRPPPSSGGPSPFERARAYLQKVPGAVSGSGGHTQTFAVAQRLVRSFALSTDDAYALLADWNQTCSPPWSERDLRRKIDQAAKAGHFAQGDMLARERAR